MPKLVISDGEATREYALKSGDTLGRTSQNAIPVKVAEASRHHCRFTEEKGAWFVEDLGSSNGTLVNGRRVTKFELQDGDVVTIGKVELKFLDAEVSPELEVSAGSWGHDDISLEDQVFLVLGLASRRGEVVKVPEGKLSVGRNAKHPLVLKDASVSGDHAEIRREGTTCSIRDLGSSNGTFVNGRRVEDAELRSGDLVRFGSIDCVFGIGDPKDFAAPEPAAAAASGDSGDEFTRSMEVSEVSEDATFEMSTVPARRETLWNILALVAILALAGGAAFLFLRSKEGGGGGGGGGRKSLDRGANLLPDWAWSFELPEGEGPKEGEAQPFWSKADLDDPADMGEVSDRVRSGHVAWRIDRAAGAPPVSLAFLDARIGVSAGDSYRISVSASGDGATPVVAALWMEEPKDAEGPVETSRDLVVGLPSSKTWHDVSGIVFAPEGTDFLRIAVGAAGTGGVVLDDVVVERVDAPPGRRHEVAHFKATLGPHGTLSLSHFGRRVIDGLGLVAKDGARALTQPLMLAVDPAAKPETIAGNLAGGRGALSVVLDGGTESFRLALRGDGINGAGTLAIPIVTREGTDIQFTVLDGDAAKSFNQGFDASVGTALIVGAGQDRAKIHLRDAAGAPLRLPVSGEFKGSTATARIACDGRQDLTLEFQLSFAKEEEEARELRKKAIQAARDKRGGEAIHACDEIIARFPFEAKIMEETSTLRDQVMAEGRKTVDGLKARIDDATFFREVLREERLAGEIATEKERFSGTSLGEELAKLEEAYKGQIDACRKPLQESEAARVLKRGKDYMDGGKTPLATLFFSSVSAAFPGSDEAVQAAAFLERLKKEGKDR